MTRLRRVCESPEVKASGDHQQVLQRKTMEHEVCESGGRNVKAEADVLVKRTGALEA